MTKQPFTPDGVQAKTTELYALPNPDLQKQSALIYADFRSWITNNFLLESDQATFLSRMDAQFANYCGTETSAAVNFRLPVSITLPDRPSSYSSKYVIINHKLVPRYDTMAGYTLTGSLNFTFGYVI